MAWIEVHQGILRHRKIATLASELGVSRATAVGNMVSLWLWCVDNAPEGDLSGLVAPVLALGAEWDGNPQIFVDGLQKAGFVDIVEGGLRLHNWHDYVGRLIEARRHQADQKRLHREFYNDKATILAVKMRDGNHCRYCGTEVSWNDRKGRYGATYDFVDPDGLGTADNVVVACRACNAGKGQRTPEQAGYNLLEPNLQKSTNPDKSISATVPYRTVPLYIQTLQTIPGWEEKGEPHKEALVSWVRRKSYTEDELERSAIGLGKVQTKTLRGYSDLAKAFQDRLNKGYDADGRRPHGTVSTDPGKFDMEEAELTAARARRRAVS